MPRQQTINQVINRVNDFNRRMRDLEEKVRNVTARINTLDDTLLKKTKTLSQDIQDLEDEIEDIRDRLANIEVDIKELNREKRKFVSSQELEELENYMDLMNPIKSSFTTKKEVKEIVEENRGEKLTREEVEEIVERKIKNVERQSLNEDK